MPRREPGEPYARVDSNEASAMLAADPDGTVDSDGGTLLTPGMMFYFLGKNKFGFNYDYYRPRTGGSVSSFRFATFLYF